MLMSSDVKDYLKTKYPSASIYAGAINKNEAQCIGVYPRGRTTPNVSIGGVENSSYWVLPVSILVHWSEDTALCEQMASTIYSDLLTAEGVTAGSIRVISFQMLDGGPVDLSRDADNICEMVIRANVIYERSVE
jgi:hypothetical protein